MRPSEIVFFVAALALCGWSIFSGHWLISIAGVVGIALISSRSNREINEAEKTLEVNDSFKLYKQAIVQIKEGVESTFVDNPPEKIRIVQWLCYSGMIDAFRQKTSPDELDGELFAFYYSDLLYQLGFPEDLGRKVFSLYKYDVNTEHSIHQAMIAGGIAGNMLMDGDADAVSFIGEFIAVGMRDSSIPASIGQIAVPVSHPAG